MYFPTALYSIVSSALPQISSLKHLMEKKERLIVPGVLQWSDNLVKFMNNFYSTTRPELIRINALEKCWEVVDQFFDLYEVRY